MDRRRASRPCCSRSASCLIGLYLGKSGVASGFGAAGSLVVLLVWVYYSAQIFLLGAEFTWVYAHDHGSKAGESKLAPAPLVPSRSGEASSSAAGEGGGGALPPTGADEATQGAPIARGDTSRPLRTPELIRNHPLKGLGVAAATGLIAGALLGRGLEAYGMRIRVSRRRWFA